MVKHKNHHERRKALKKKPIEEVLSEAEEVLEELWKSIEKNEQRMSEINRILEVVKNIEGQISKKQKQINALFQ